ncbi:MAG TPA: hypothetical protein VF715_00575 [Thermoleophilaceae bacterium]
MGDRIVIERRFNGPPDSANGGYTCGCVARAFGGSGPGDGAVQVSLRQPPPLEEPLDLERSDEGARLLAGDGLVADASVVSAESLGEPPGFVEPGEARDAATRSFYLNDSHPFPSCFVCGPRRAEGDGLRIFPGPLGEMFAAPWRPADDLARADGTVAPEIVWAALDCPTSAPGMNQPGPDGRVLPIVLARLAVEVTGEVRAGAEHVITSREIWREGRKREAGAALYSAGGELLARARALWIELKAAPG